MAFETLKPAPADPILGLTEAFKADTNPKKVNLGVGVYVDDSGKTPILDCVRKAEQEVVGARKTKSYLPISGSPAYAACVQELMFGADHSILKDKRARTAQTPGGTGALRVGADFLKVLGNRPVVWFSRPTWANHKGIFSDAGYEMKEYPYYDAATRGLDFAAMEECLSAVPEGDVVLLHVCCHNPTGVDLDIEQWQRIADIAADRKWIPFFDFAYQGFGEGLEEDAAGLLTVSGKGIDFLVASSFSKNFGLYCDRVGALTLVAADSKAADTAFSHVKITIRRSYSNPPAHGGELVTHIMNTPELREQWVQEVAMMRDRINGVRAELVNALAKRNAPIDFSFIHEQHGMFSFSGLSDEQVTFLREKKSIYIVGGGRVNVAGITSANIDYVADSMCEALALG